MPFPSETINAFLFLRSTALVFLYSDATIACGNPRSSYTVHLLRFLRLGPNRYRTYGMGSARALIQPSTVKVQCVPRFLYMGMPTTVMPPAARYLTSATRVNADAA